MKQFTQNEITIMLNAIDHIAQNNFIIQKTSNKLSLKSQPEDNAYAIGFQDCIDVVKACLFPNNDEND
jgi:hypothetical protein